MKPTELWNAGARSPLDGGIDVEPGDALVVATSGTTGEPKGVVLTMPSVRAAAMITSDALELSIDEDRRLLCLPVAHMGCIDRHQITADRRCDHRPPPLRASGCRGGCQPGGHGRLAGSSRPR